MSSKLTIILGVAALAFFARSNAAEPLVQLHKGDHIAIVGSGLADRQQHHAWFESLIHQAFPDEQLTIRNLGFAADEINVHPRSKDVPSVEWFLSMKKGDSTLPDRPDVIYKAGTDFGADVIFAYWGFNESFRGPQGLEDFKTNLTKYLGALKAARFNGKSAPRIVLFSPIAQESVDDPNYPDAEENNRNIGLYTHAMEEIAKAQEIPFVNLFEPSTKIYQASETPLTINGIHLTNVGDQQLAPIQFKAVFGKEPAAMNDPRLAKINAAVLEKNNEWVRRYRTVDQYNIYGDRSRIAYEGVTNAMILGQEMAQRDVKTANRDQLVWAVANGKSYTVTDDNLPMVDLTPPNRPESVPYDDPEDAIKHLKLAPGCKVELVASEITFPDLINPVQMAFDTKGRLWVATWPNYPETSPTTKVFDKILIFDLDPKSGKVVKSTIFADGLNCPTGFQFYKDGILLMQSPDLLWVRDTDGDDQADTIERVLHGLDAADSHHETNSICYEPGGAVYLSDGVFHRSNVETAKGPVRNVDGAIYRYEPVAGKFTRHVPYNFANPHGRVFDYWGNDLITDATGNANYFGPAMSGHLDAGAHPPMKEFWDRPSRPCAGTAILSSRHFPDDWQGSFLNANVIGMQGIFRAKLTDEGSGIRGETLENLIETDVAANPNFRPSGISVAPDGSLYLMDWSQMLIGHLQHHLRDPNRDHQHGRIYRITYEGRPLLVPKKIAGEPIPALLQLLTEPENDVRLRAKIELGKHDSKEVTAGVMDWVHTLDPAAPDYEHHLLEALWVHQWHNVVNPQLLDRMLKSTEPRARAQAVRVLGYWHDRIPHAVNMVKAAATDEAPRVRLEAVRVASFFPETAAADAALAALQKPMDYYIDYCFKETMRQLKPWWENAVAEGKEIAINNPAGISWLLDSVSSNDLAKLPKTPVTLTAMLTRPDVTMDQRKEALTALSTMRKSSAAITLVDLISGIDAKDTPGTRALATLLLEQPASDLKAARAPLGKLATDHPSPIVRETAIAAIIVADGSVKAVWADAQNSPDSLMTFLKALPLVPDANARATAFPAVSGVLTALPLATAAALQSGDHSGARFVRIELPRKGTLTLAEVQVMSRGKNIAASGKASQHSTAFAGQASRAIDGNTDGIYNNQSATHTREEVANPWWELDLGSEQPIDSISIWNRTDGPYGNRMKGFTLTLLDANRQEIFRETNQPAPSDSLTIEPRTDTKGDIRRAAIAALPAVGQPEQTFGILAQLIRSGDNVPVAAHALNALPTAQWPKEQVALVAKGIVDWAKTVPADDRTSNSYDDTIAVATKVISLLPEAQAAVATKALGDLTVQSFTIRTVPEQMRYDIAQLVVEAGKPFQIVFENPDAMPHNMVFVQPGTYQDVAVSVQTQAPDKLDSKGRAYIPENDPRVIAATHMIEPGKSEILHLTAPEKEDTYEYVCTFPGHWAIMNGKLIVTKDVAAWHAANPQK